MWRGLAKWGLLTAFGRIPGGSRAYRTITRGWMGTQATHVEKLRRVWPGYVDVWRTLAGLDLRGADVWVHEGGWTPFPSLVNQLVTGRPGVVTNHEARLMDRYLAAAVDGVLACPIPGLDDAAERRAAIARLRDATDAWRAIVDLGGRLIEGVDLRALPLADSSVDLCHSGGALEHRDPATLQAFLLECRRILRPGAVMSHVIDHRDHLRHADPRWDFLSHLRWEPETYRLLLGQPLTYHNRLLPSEVAALFEAAGFEPVALRRMLLPSHEYVASEAEALAGTAGIERRRLATPFRAATDADLRTAAAHYLFRNPS